MSVTISVLALYKEYIQACLAILEWFSLCKRYWQACLSQRIFGFHIFRQLPGLAFVYQTSSGFVLGSECLDTKSFTCVIFLADECQFVMKAILAFCLPARVRWQSGKSSKILKAMSELNHRMETLTSSCEIILFVFLRKMPSNAVYWRSDYNLV